MPDLNISGKTQAEVLAKFRANIDKCRSGICNVDPAYSCRHKLKRCNTVDGNPTAAIKMCYPYPRANIIKSNR